MFTYAVRRIAAVLCALLLAAALIPGAMASCAHNSYWTEEVYENETWIAQSDRACRKYADVFTEKWCNDCSEMFERSPAGVQTPVDLAGHSYENNVCRKCGYVNTCAHGDTFAYQRKYSTADVLGSDADSHTRAVDVFDIEICSLCDVQLKDDHAGTVTATEKHRFSFGGVCSVCGYQRTAPCAHEYLNEYETFRSSRMEVTLLQHIRTGDLYRIVECSECWETLSEELIGANVTRAEDHVYDPAGMGLDVCSRCDYRPECTHPSATLIQNVFDIGGYTVDPVSPTLHRTSGYLSDREICDVCGAIVSLETVDDWTQIFGEHTFLHGECTECGYRDVCLHEDVNTGSAAQSGARPISGEEHAFVTRQIETDVCAYCDREVGRRTLSASVQPAEPHAFQSGKCTLCGFAEGTDAALELPADAAAIGAEAFRNTDARFVVLPDGCGSVGAKAFSDNPQLTAAYMPDSVTEIAPDAFEGSDSVIFICPSDNASAAYARNNGLPVLVR